MTTPLKLLPMIPVPAGLAPMILPFTTLPVEGLLVISMPNRSFPEITFRSAAVVPPNDYQATLLHLLGLDHTKLVYHSNGREQRLTDGRPARVVAEILG